MKRPKYTKSQDWTMRTTVKVEFRLDKEDYELLQRYADAEGFEDVAEIFRAEGSLAVESLVFEIKDKYPQ